MLVQSEAKIILEEKKRHLILTCDTKAVVKTKTNFTQQILKMLLHTFSQKRKTPEKIVKPSERLLKITDRLKLLETKQCDNES